MKASTYSVAAMAVVMALIMSTLPAVAHGETWVEVKGGPYAIAPDELTRLKETLFARMVVARHWRAVRAPDWRKYLIQYRTEIVQGHRVVDVHGSCEFDPHQDLTLRFYDEEVSDGGTCYFQVKYLLESGTYSNVLFHGLG